MILLTKKLMLLTCVEDNEGCKRTLIVLLGDKMYKLLCNLANILEIISRNIKRQVNTKICNKFLKKYCLCDGITKSKRDIKFNSYEATSIPLIERLICSDIISYDDTIMDIGCGAGIFLIYLHSRGFTNLIGVELDRELYNLCKKNISMYYEKNNCLEEEIRIIQGNALNLLIPDEVTVFYLFNPFFDEKTYFNWLCKVKESIDRNRRKIQIVFLFPTISSMGAARKCKWLTEKKRIICKSVVCYQCSNYLVYESEV